MPIIEGTLEEVKKKGENYSWIIQKWNDFEKWQSQWVKEMRKGLNNLTGINQKHIEGVKKGR